MRRLYFLTPDADAARKLVDELLLARVPVNHIHAVAREGADSRNLPLVTVAERSDLFPAMFRGGTLGAITGLAIGTALVNLPPLVARLEGGLPTAGTVLGAAALVGVSVPNTRLRRFRREINEGTVLVMVDTRADSAEKVRVLVTDKRPEWRFEDYEP